MAATFAVTDAKVYRPLVTSLTQDNTKLMGYTKQCKAIRIQKNNQLKQISVKSINAGTKPLLRLPD